MRALNATAAREIKNAEKRRRGESLEQLSPAQRKEVSRAGGRATSFKRTAEQQAMTAEVFRAGRERAALLSRLRSEAIGPGNMNRPVKLPRTGARNRQQTFLKLLYAAVERDPAKVSLFLDGIIDRHLRKLSKADRAAVAAYLHDTLSGRIAAELPDTPAIEVRADFTVSETSELTRTRRRSN